MLFCLFQYRYKLKPILFLTQLHDCWWGKNGSTTVSREPRCWRHRLELGDGAEVKDGDRRDAASPPHLRGASRVSGLAERPASGGMRRPGAVDFVDEWGVRYFALLRASRPSRAGAGGGEAVAAAGGGGVSDVSLPWHTVRIIANVRSQGPSSWFI